jgi:hypothetical protein
MQRINTLNAYRKSVKNVFVPERNKNVINLNDILDLKYDRNTHLIFHPYFLAPRPYHKKMTYYLLGLCSVRPHCLL